MMNSSSCSLAVRFRKGIPYLLNAFRKVRHPRRVLKIVHGVLGEIRGYLAKAPLDNVEFHGVVPNAELPAVMSSAHVMVLPSIEERLALVLAEAIACGCPVIASTNTGGEDLLTDGVEGFIAPIRDPGAIADRLNQLIDDPDLRMRMSAAAQARISEIGGWDQYGDRYEALCRSLTTTT